VERKEQEGERGSAKKVLTFAFYSPTVAGGRGNGKTGGFGSIAYGLSRVKRHSSKLTQASLPCQELPCQPVSKR
jgi:hypothetical protein